MLRKHPIYWEQSWQPFLGRHQFVMLGILCLLAVLPGKPDPGPVLPVGALGKDISKPTGLVSTQVSLPVLFFKVNIAPRKSTQYQWSEVRVVPLGQGTQLQLKFSKAFPGTTSSPCGQIPMMPHGVPEPGKVTRSSSPLALITGSCLLRINSFDTDV